MKKRIKQYLITKRLEHCHVESGDFAKVLHEGTPADCHRSSMTFGPYWAGGYRLDKGTVLRIVHTEVSKYDSKTIYVVGEAISSSLKYRIKAKDLKKI